MSRSRQIVGLAGWLLLCFAAAAAGAFASRDAGAFYGQLLRPVWAPPAWLFAPVWTVLYALMGISAWLVWRGPRTAGVRASLGLFVAQLIANALWTWIFFVWKEGAMAFAEIVLLWFLIGANVILFWRLNVRAAVLLLPYWIWVTFATALTWSTWQMNPGVL